MPSSGSTVDTEAIQATHAEMKRVVESYREINRRVSSVTADLEEHWAGDGRNEFESQYNLLIRKIEDFGDTLQDIYEALVDAEAKYRNVDERLKQDLEISAGG
ncbi:MAG: WXG100 family type VII secretion target [Oscillibacter sp.]|nr:WXG100 family type VII secretion target [Oscillibacter sp.]MBQ7682478.1 WXG100 family type VII secretion target [Oscillibacter sp.]MBQ9618289.1 WXG100 family type VII secretion target [Oscillibacter sp.]